MISDRGATESAPVQSVSTDIAPTGAVGDNTDPVAPALPASSQGLPLLDSELHAAIFGPPLVEVGRVSEIGGSPGAIGPDGEYETLQPGDAIYLGDALQAGAGGRLSISLRDGGSLHLGPDGRVLLTGAATGPGEDASPLRIFLQQGEIAVVPRHAVADGGGIVDVQSLVGDVYGIGPLTARYSASSSLEVTVLPHPGSAAAGLEVTADAQSQSLSQAFDHATVAWGDAVTIRLDHLDCTDPRLHFAGELGLTGPACGAREEVDDLKTSPGGDIADSGSFTVTRPVDAFDLKPEAAPLADPSAVDLVGAAARFSLRSHLSDLLLRGTEDFTDSSADVTNSYSYFSTSALAGYDFSLMRLWDPGRTWRGLGDHAELAPYANEVPLESARLIPSRAGEMAQLEASGALPREVEAFLGLTRGSLDKIIDYARPAEGGAMRLEDSIHLQAGQTIWFDTFFDAADPPPNDDPSNAFHDFAVLTVSTHGSTMLVPIADENPQVLGATGWRAIKYTAGVSGDYTFGFAVINDGDGGNSRLYVDKVRFQDADTDFGNLGSRTDSLGGTLQILAPKPVAKDDVITVFANTPSTSLREHLLANDLDPDTFDGWGKVGIDRSVTPQGSVNLVSISQHVQIDYNPRGVFDYLAKGDIGIDTFKYTIDGGNLQLASAIVTVNVIGVNDAPTAHDDVFEVDEDLTVALGVLANDVDPDQGDHIQLVSVEGEGASVLGDALVFNPGIQFQQLAVGETVTQFVKYTIEDDAGLTSQGEITVTIHGANDAPTARADTATTDQDTKVAIATVANDTDPDLTDRLQVVAIDGALLEATTPVTLASGAKVSLANDGRLVYDPNGAFATLAAGQTGSDSFVYRVGDGHGGFADATAVVTISGVNDAPIAVADHLDAGEDGPTTAAFSQLLVNDHDRDQGDHIRLVGASGEGVRLDGGSLVFDPGAQFQYLAVGETATRVVQYIIADDSEGTAAANITVTVHGANDAPVAAVDVVETVEERQQITLNVVANDRDPDLSDKLTITAIAGQSIDAGSTVDLASGARVMLQANGTLAYDPTGAFTYLGFQQRENEEFTYTIADGNGSTAEATIKLGISGVNDGPTTLNDIGPTINEDHPYRSGSPDFISVPVLANDSDPDRDDYIELVTVDNVKVVLGHDIELPSGLAFKAVLDSQVAGGLILQIYPQSAFNYLGAEEIHTEVVSYTIKDQLDARSSASVSFTVIGANDAPIAGADTQYAIDEDHQLSFGVNGGVLANDTDPDVVDRQHLIVSAVAERESDVGKDIALASGGLFRLNSDGSFTYSPPMQFNKLQEGESQKEIIGYTISDPYGSKSSSEITIQVVGVNDPPDALPDIGHVDANVSVRLNVVANDFDWESAHLQVIAIDEDHKGFVRINPDRSLTYDPAGRFDSLAPGSPATDTFTYTIEDDKGANVNGTVTVTIHGSDAPKSINQSIVESFEVSGGSLVWGWDRNPGPMTPLTEATLFSGFSGTGALAPYGPTHLGTAVLIRGEGVKIETGQSALEDDLELSADHGLPDDTGAHSHQTGDGTSAKSGSAIRTEIAFTAADLNAQGKLFISFDWNFFSAEQVNPSQPGANDYAVFTVSDGLSSKVLTLSDARETGLGASGWRTSTYDLTSLFGSGVTDVRSITLGFAVVNDEADQRPSSLLLDNVRINAPVASDAELLPSNQDAAFKTYRHNPTARADAGATLATTEDALLTIDLETLLANDMPSPGTDHITFDDLDGPAGKGTVSDNGTQITYSPIGKYDALAAGELGSDTFHYRITDANGGIGVGEVTIAIIGVNDAPTTTAFDAESKASENGLPIGILDVLAHADDADSDDSSTTLRVLSASAASGAEVHLSGDRGQDFIYDPSKTADFESLGIGQTATDVITYTVADRHGATAIGQVTVTVQGVNDAPTAAGDSITVDEEHVVDLLVLANDHDPDRNDTLKVVRINGQSLSVGNPLALASGALILLTNDGRLQFSPNSSYDHLPAGQSESVSFTYTATDNHGGSTDATVALTIAGLNDAPLATANTMTADEDHAASLAVSAFLADPDTGDALHLVEAQGPGASFTATTLTYDPASRFHYLGAGQTATEHLTYTVTDSHGATTQGGIAVTIEGRNDAPDAVADTAARTREDEALTLSPLANDTDPDTPDQGHLSILSIDTHDTLGTVTLNADGTVRYDPAGHFNYLNGGQTATDHFAYTVGDGHGGTDTATVTLTIDGRNSLEEIVQSFEPPFVLGVDPSVARTGAISTVSTYVELDATPQRTYTPTDGSKMIKLEATGSLIGSVETFLGLSTGTIKNTFPDLDGTSPANSSAIKTTIAVHAGDEISFDWMFDARDYVNNPPDGKADNDMAVLVVTGIDGTNLYKLADVRQTGNLGATDWRSSAYTAQHDGTLTIGLASINDRTALPLPPQNENSVLLIDNIRLNRDFDDSYQLVQTSNDHHLDTYVHHT